jgi:oligopeptide transport system permease protein
MIRYIVRRVLWLIPVMFVVSLVTFILMHAAPGGPWDREVGARQLPASTVRQLNLTCQIDEPVWNQ